MNKILMILLVVLCLSSCKGNNYVAIENTQGVVEKVELSDYKIKYKVFVKCQVHICTLEKEKYMDGFYLYTNKLYSVGDTIYIK